MESSMRVTRHAGHTASRTKCSARELQNETWRLTGARDLVRRRSMENCSREKGQFVFKRHHSSAPTLIPSRMH
jgi:hypothetical protein